MSIEPHALLRTARRWWWLLLLAPFVGVAAGLAIAAVQAPRWQATATVVVVPTREPGVLVFDDLETGARIAAMYARLATGSPVLAAAGEALEPPVAAGQLADAVAAQAVTDLPLIEIAASSDDPAQAAAIANAVADELVRRIRADAATRLAPVQQALDAQIGRARSAAVATPGAPPEASGDASASLGELEAAADALAQRAAANDAAASVWAPATPPAEPAAPRRAVLAVLGALVALMLAGAGVLLAALLDQPRPAPATRAHRP